MTLRAGFGEAVETHPPGPPVRLTDHLWQVAGAGISHPWDAAAYLVLDGDPWLIDCGCPLGAAALRAHLGGLGVGPGDVHRRRRHPRPPRCATAKCSRPDGPASKSSTPRATRRVRCAS